MFVANCITEILDLTSPDQWRLFKTCQNPADDITRGKPLMELTEPCRWNRGPAFLAKPPEQWSCRSLHTQDPIPDIEGLCSVASPSLISIRIYLTPVALLPGKTSLRQPIKAFRILQNTTLLEPHPLPRPRFRYFSQELNHTASLTMSKPLSLGKNSPQSRRLSSLSPQYEPKLNLIQVGGRLRLAAELEPGAVYPIVLDPIHPVTR